MEGRTVVVTGGNSGIGLATATALARAGARTVLTARDPGRGAAAVEEVRRRSGGTVELALFDLADLASVRAGAAELLERLPRLDVLVNNAGIVLSDRRETVDGYESTFAVNHLGPFLLTTLLTGRLVASAPARVVTVASVAHRYVPRGLDFADLQSRRDYRGMRVYARSKLANLLFTAELARRLAGTGVTVNALHPGTVATGYGRDGDTHGFLPFGMDVIRSVVLTPEEGARTSVFLATSLSVEGVTGRYFVRSRARTPSAAARDAGAARRLWAVSEQLVAGPVG